MQMTKNTWDTLTRRDRDVPGGMVRVAMPLAGVCCLAMIGGCRPTGPAVEMVEGVVVTFQPIAGAGLLAVGMTGPNGRFTLNATRGGPPGAGTAVGEYVVTLSKTTGGYEKVNGPGPQVQPASDVEPQNAAYEAWAREQEGLKPKPLPPVEHLIPPTYGDEQTSGFRVAVKKGRNAGAGFHFALRSDFRGAAPP